MSTLNRCTCGRTPRIRAIETRHGTWITQATCPGLSCEAQGQPIEDFERNDDVAADLWNRHGGRKVA